MICASMTCRAGQICIRNPKELGTSGLKLPPTTDQDVSLWHCSKNTISRISAHLCWAAAQTHNAALSQNPTTHRHRKTNYKQHSFATLEELFGSHSSPFQQIIVILHLKKKKGFSLHKTVQRTLPGTARDAQKANEEEMSHGNISEYNKE